MTARSAFRIETWAALSALSLLAVTACSGGGAVGSELKDGTGGGAIVCADVQKGGGPGCDDHDACTIDSWDVVAGCVHEAARVDDGDACTADDCDPATGLSHAPVSCDDGDLCTADGCDPAVGCVHAQVAGVDDGDACTLDSCDPSTGAVVHALVPSCCPHSACAAGAPLNMACSYPGLHNDCVAVVCAYDPFCCSSSWDSTCVAHTRDPEICPTGSLPDFFSCACLHSYCKAGGPLPRGCDPCVKKVCDVDPSCCGNAWDAVCVGEVSTLCDVPPGADCK